MPRVICIGDEALPFLLAGAQQCSMKDFRQGVHFQACACAPGAQLVAHTVLFPALTQWHLFLRSVSAGEKSRLETEVSFPVEILEELTRAVLSGEKDPGGLFGGTLAAAGPIDGHLQSLYLVKTQFRNFQGIFKGQ